MFAAEKLSQATATDQDVTACCLCCKLKLTRLSRVVLIIPVTFTTTLLFASLCFIVDSAVQEQPSPLSDFVRVFPLFSYSAFVNGFFICNSSKTYKSILNNFIHCKSQQSVISVVSSTRESLSFNQNESKQEQSITVRSKAIVLAPEV